MNNELLLLFKKHTDTLIEQTKTKPQETMEFKMNKQTQSFSFNSPINLVEEGKWLMAVVCLIAQILSLTSPTKTTVFNSLYQVFTKTILMKKLLMF